MALRRFVARMRAWLGARRRGALFGLGVLAFAVLGVAGFAPLARYALGVLAARRGLRIQVQTVRPGLRGVWLQGVHVQVLRAPGIDMQADTAELALVGGRALSVHGARLRLHGSLAELRAQYQNSRPERTAESSGESTRFALDGIDITWVGAAGAGPPQRVWGAAYERNGAGEQLSADLARLAADGVSCELRHPRARLSAHANHRVVEAFGVDGAEIHVALTAPEIQHDSRVAGHAPGQRDAFRPDPLRGPKLRALLREMATGLTRVLPDGGAFDLGGVRAELVRGAERLNLGPSELRIARTGSAIALSLTPKGAPPATELELKALLPVDAGEVSLEVRGGPVSLGAIGVREGDLGLTDVARARLQAKASVVLDSDGSRVRFSGTGALSDFSLQRAELSAEPLRGMRVAFRGRGSAELDGSKITVDDGELEIGDVHASAHGSLERSEAWASATLSMAIQLAACQGLLDAMPSGFAPLLASVRMSGTFALDSALRYDSRRPTDTRVQLHVANDCKISQVSADLAPRRFSSTWFREVKGPDGRVERVESGPGSGDWVPYEAISPFVETGVLVCEDAHFFRHHGFDYEAIQNSIRDNLLKGRFVRGGSTISMQLAKNLYLAKEKTLGRKLQEAVLTMLLEQELDKRTLMELYLNVIEYGPGIYGIGAAAQYYFGKAASDLSLGQALYLASILPSPDRQHFEPDGHVTVGWTKYLRRLMTIAHKIHRITDQELDAGLAEELAFRVSDPNSLPATRDPAADPELEPYEKGGSGSE